MITQLVQLARLHWSVFALAEWVAATGKNLTTIYVTHGHGDHFFGMSVLLDRFPNARPLALPAVVERMRRQGAPALVSAFWNEQVLALHPNRVNPDALWLSARAIKG